MGFGFCLLSVRRDGRPDGAVANLGGAAEGAVVLWRAGGGADEHFVTVALVPLQLAVDGEVVGADEYDEFEVEAVNFGEARQFLLQVSG